MGERRRISLVVADVDGTLVTEQKVLTQRAQAAVHALHRAGIRFAITSARPPRGMAMLFDALALETPIAGFNGGLFVRRDLSILEQKTVEPDIARQALALIREHGLDAWVYSGNDWLITKPGAPHVAREAWTVKFEPTVVADFDDRLDTVAKIVGVSDDLDRVRRCEADAQAAFGQRATANRSQPYYLDVGRTGSPTAQPPPAARRRMPPVLSADLACLGEEVRAVDEAGADWIHVDVMGGRFVPNIMIGPVVLQAIRRSTAKPLNVHLMVVEPERYLSVFADAAADHLLVQGEPGPTIHLHRVLTQIRALDKKAGVVLAPASPPEMIEYVLHLCESFW